MTNIAHRPCRSLFLLPTGIMDVPEQIEWWPAYTWPYFFYKQQNQYFLSDAWQTWYIAGNGTGKSLTLYVNIVLQMAGLHPRQLGPPPIKVKVLVPSFDYVEDVALEKLQAPQRIVFSELEDVQKAWIDVLNDNNLVKNFREPSNGTVGSFEIPPMIPKHVITKGYSREHKGLELKKRFGGSSIWFVTSEQGWQAQRGGEQDLLVSDEEGDERVFDELKRGLRNAKGGGKIYAGLTPPFQEGQGPTWTKEKVLEASYDDDEINVINACMADNPAITAKFIKEFSKGKTKKQIDVQIFGKYPTWGDLVHPDFQDRVWNPQKIDGHLLSNDTPMPSNHAVDWVMSFDWHQSKPTAAIFGFFDTDGNFTIFDEIDEDWARGKEISDLAETFRQIEGQPFNERKFRRWQDPSAKSQYHAVQKGFNAWDAFRKEGIVTSAGKNRDPEVGISIVNDYFRGNGKDHPRVFIYERCKHTRRYLTNNYWKRNEAGVGVPDPKWSDYPVCIRYILQEMGWKKHRSRKAKWPIQSFMGRKSHRQMYDVGRFF